MSRAFIKEDVDVYERPGQRRSQSGLPPGALNYMTPEGARRLRARLEKLLREPVRDVGNIESSRKLCGRRRWSNPGGTGTVCILEQR